MPIVMTLFCSGPEGADICSEKHSGFSETVKEGHNFIKEGWELIIKKALEAGWIRNTRDNRFRCPDCSAKVERKIYNIPLSTWNRAIDLYVSGKRAAEWGGKDGLPTATQWHQALAVYPELKEKARLSPIWSGDRDKAAVLDKSIWQKVEDRIRAGEVREQIATGQDGWPTTGQWDGRRERNKAFRKLIEDTKAGKEAAFDAELNEIFERFISGERLNEMFGDNHTLRNRWYKRLQTNKSFRSQVYEQHRINGSASYTREHSEEMYQAAIQWIADGNKLSDLPGIPHTCKQQAFSKRVGVDPVFAARYNAALEATDRMRNGGRKGINFTYDWDSTVKFIFEGGTVEKALRLENSPSIAQWSLRKRTDEGFSRLVDEALRQAREQRKAITKERNEHKAKALRQARELKKLEAVPVGVAFKLSLNQNELYFAVSKAVSLGIPDHIRDDVISSMILSILEGDLQIEDIKTHARKFVTAYHREAGTYTNVSADGIVRGTEDMRLIDTIQDGAQQYY